MARRKERLGDHLATDDYTGQTCYASQLQRDFWGSLAKHPLKRNLQEISSPLNDPAPVSVYRGPNYEDTSNCPGETAPLFIGNTNVPTRNISAAYQALNLDPGIGDAAIGCSFVVH